MSKAVKCPEDEKRMIVSVDMRKMDRIKVGETERERGEDDGNFGENTYLFLYCFLPLSSFSFF